MERAGVVGFCREWVVSSSRGHCNVDSELLFDVGAHFFAQEWSGCEVLLWLVSMNPPSCFTEAMQCLTGRLCKGYHPDAVTSHCANTAQAADQ